MFYILINTMEKMRSILIEEELYKDIQEMILEANWVPLKMSMAKKIIFLYMYWAMDQQTETFEDVKKRNPWMFDHVT